MTSTHIVKSGIGILAVCAVLLALGGPALCSDNPLSVYVVNYPLKYFAERIGGGHVDVALPVPQDVDPVYWAPSIADIGRYQQADLILLNGAGYAKWVGKVSLPRSKTVDTSRSFQDRYITAEEVTTHSHGADGKHAHEGLAFTTWLDLDLAAKQADAVCRALIRKRPHLKMAFETAYAELADTLKVLDRELQSMTSTGPVVPLLMSHPVYDYLTARYGLNTVSVHWEPDQVPDDARMRALASILKTHPAKWMVWEGKPERAAVEKLEAMGLKSLVFDPCGNVPEKGDFLSVMQENVKNLKQAFKASGK